MLILYGQPIILILFLTALTSLIAGIVSDIRWAIVSLMIVFIFTPAILCYLYFFHGLRRTTAINSIDHILNFSQEELSVDALQHIDTEKEDQEEGDEKPEYKKIYRLSYPYTLIDSCKPSRTGYVIRMLAPEKGFLWLPYDAFETQTEMNRLMQFLRQRISDITNSTIS